MSDGFTKHSLLNQLALVPPCLNFIFAQDLVYNKLHSSKSLMALQYACISTMMIHQLAPVLDDLYSSHAE